MGEGTKATRHISGGSRGGSRGAKEPPFQRKIEVQSRSLIYSLLVVRPSGAPQSLEFA